MLIKKCHAQAAVRSHVDAGMNQMLRGVYSEGAYLLAHVEVGHQICRTQTEFVSQPSGMGQLRISLAYRLFQAGS